MLIPAIAIAVALKSAVPTPNYGIPVYEFNHPDEIRIKCEEVCKKEGKVFDGVRMDQIDDFTAAAKCVCKERDK